MNKLILNNQEEIPIEVGSSLSDIKVLSGSKQDMLSVWNMLLVDENLKSVKIQNDEKINIGNYENLVLNSETSTIQKDGKILTSFYLREKTEVELLKEEIKALKECQEVQDGAIMDLGEAVSELSK